MTFILAPLLRGKQKGVALLHQENLIHNAQHCDSTCRHGDTHILCEGDDTPEEAGMPLLSRLCFGLAHAALHHPGPVCDSAACHVLCKATTANKHPVNGCFLQQSTSR